jgi:hypothetical protein
MLMAVSSRHIFLCILLFLSLPHASEARAAQVVFITSEAKADSQWPTIDALCDFYGLTCDVRAPSQGAAEPNSLQADLLSTLAVIVRASALSPVGGQVDARALWDRIEGSRAQVLVLSDAPLLLSLPDVPIPVNFVALPKDLSSWQIAQGNRRVTRELAGVSGTVRKGASPRAIVLDADGRSELTPLMSVQSTDGVWHPIYAELRDTERSIFFAAISPSSQGRVGASESGDESGFTDLAPVLTFLRLAGGQYCWHRDNDYANLTIDDPWLVEPYGCLSYRRLLAEMQKARFHTTIAFIPWNYDRSDESVVDIFRDHPEFYSICVHGNNHDHWEFYKYSTTSADPWPAKPLAVQEANIRQGLARMEEFSRLTGLDFDRVMVFPQHVAPMETFGVLKRYNLLATVNLTNVPLDLEPPADPTSRLRAFTARYANFASVSRHLPTGRSQAQIALDLFLDNPVLFFEHHTLFRNGTGAFNGTAEMVNSLQPAVQWAGLGTIARHLYIERDRPDGSRDVRMFCRSIDLVNDQEHEQTCFIEKEETSDVPVRQVLVNGATHSYAVSQGRLQLSVAVEPHQPCRIEIQYEDHFQASQVDISKNDRRINRLRALSDFRDRTVYRHKSLRWIVDSYYASGLYRLGLVKTAILFSVFAVALTVGGWKLARRTRRATSRRRPSTLRVK